MATFSNMSRWSLDVYSARSHDDDGRLYLWTTGTETVGNCKIKTTICEWTFTIANYTPIVFNMHVNTMHLLTLLGKSAYILSITSTGFIKAHTLIKIVN